ASSQGSVITIQAVNAGAPFRLACSLALAPTGNYASPTSPESWIATLDGSFGNDGGSLTTTINGIALKLPVFASTTVSGRLAGRLAPDVANQINQATDLDPVTKRPLNSLVTAAGTLPPLGAKGTVTITANDVATHFTLACSADSL